MRVPVFVRRLLLLAVLVLGCTQPAWHLRSPHGIPQNAPIWIEPSGGDDDAAIAGFDGRIVGLLVHDGALVRQDAAWTIEVRIKHVRRCRHGLFTPGTANGIALVSIRNHGRLTDRVDVSAGVKCGYGHSGAASAHAVGEALARRVADIAAWRRHAW